MCALITGYKIISLDKGVVTESGPFEVGREAGRPNPALSALFALKKRRAFTRTDILFLVSILLSILVSTPR